jgi:ribose transport system ATP-binding protein
MEAAHVAGKHQKLTLEGRGLSGELVTDLDFDLHEGEVLGIAGLAGSGREELPYLVGGARPLRAGELRLGGRPMPRLTPRSALAAGLVLVAGDRQRQSAIPSLNVRENLCLPRLTRSGPLRWVSIRGERRETRRWMDRMEVTPHDPDRPLTTFSGGNQQKIVMARALRLAPRVLILDEPAQGVDVGAKVALFKEVAEVAAEGLAVVVTSSDPEDLATVCDRILVLREGRVIAELQSGALNADRIVEETLATDEGRN